MIVRQNKFNKDEKVTFTFDSNGGKTVKIIKVERGKEVTLPNTVRDGYSFQGWYINDKKATTTVIAENNTTYKAKWEKNLEETKSFTITFDSTGGTEVENITIDCEKPITLPDNITRNGYTFITWVDENLVPIQSGALLECQDITLYAKWNKVDERENYSCPKGYSLEDNKCVAESPIITSCPEGTKGDGNLCIQVSDYIKGTRTCGKKIVNMGGGSTPTVDGIKVDAGITYCYYGEVLDDKETCHARGRSWCNSCNKCYIEMDHNYTITCPEDYQYYSSNDILNKFGGYNNEGCYRKVERLISCEKDFNFENGRCIKTVEPIIQ